MDLAGACGDVPATRAGEMLFCYDEPRFDGELIRVRLAAPFGAFQHELLLKREDDGTYTLVSVTALSGT